MILNSDRYPVEKPAAIDAQGNVLTYGELCTFPKEVVEHLAPRSLVFMLTENTVGGIAWIIGLLDSGNVPLILNAHTEKELFTNMVEIYRPAYICAPSWVIMKQ